MLSPTAVTASQASREERTIFPHKSALFIPVNKPVRPVMEAPGLFSYKAVFLGVESVTLGKEDHYRTRKSECYSGRKVPEHRHLHTVTSGPSKQSGGAVLSVIRVWGKTFRSHRKIHQENKSPLVPTTSPRPTPTTTVFGVDTMTRHESAAAITKQKH